MDHMVPRERDDSGVVDLESGGTTSEEEGGTGNNNNNNGIREGVSAVRQTKKYLGRVWSGVLNVDESIVEDHGLGSSNSVSNSSDDNGEVLVGRSSGGEETMGLLAKRTVKEKKKKAGSKKPPKPPRPPGGVSLDAADQKLIREISELALLKRARRERLKAQKKMKAGKPSSPSSSSSSSSVCAMIITVLFCLIIIFQGMFSRSSSHASFDGSPESATVNRGSLISVQFFKSPSSSNSGSESPNQVEQVAGSDPENERNRAVAG